MTDPIARRGSVADDVALKIQAYVDRIAILHGLAAPHSIGVFLTFENPLASIRDFACPSVKLLAPETGACGFVVLGDETAGVVEDGGVVCPNAEAEINVTAAAVVTITRMFSVLSE